MIARPKPAGERTARAIEEIGSRETGQFWERYVLPQRPVVVRQFFAGQPLADLDIQSYDLKSVVPAATFTMTATP